jgi:NitT/TauT family transport system ATP-binding protein
VTDRATDRRGVSINVSDLHMVFERKGTRVEALSGISLDINPGRFCSVLGPSGCGKSTLLMLVAGLYRPTAGIVRVDGEPLTDCYPDCGIVFQVDVLLPWLSVLDNVLLPAQVKRLPKTQATARARELIDQVGLTGFESHFPNELSGGMRQRAALCRALLHEPSVLLMDEPFGALDALTRERMQLDLTHLGSTGQRTVLFITHDIEEAVFLSDEVVVMSQRPARILQRFAVDFPQPRAPEIRREPGFHRIIDDIRDLFRETGIL